MKVAFSVFPDRKTLPSHINQRTGYLQKNAIAIRGICRVYAGSDEFWGGHKSRRYLSKPMIDPTWQQIHNCATTSLKYTKDYHHIFLEGVSFDPVLSSEMGMPCYELCFGS